MTKELRLGGHLRADEGLAYVVATARGMMYNEVQIMCGNGTDYTPWDVSQELTAKYRKLSYEITTTVHFPYVINPCEQIPQRRGYYKQSFKKYIDAAEALGARRIVVHPGFKKDLTEAQAYTNLMAFVEQVWKEDTRLELLLETDSGSKNGSAIGSAEFIAEVIANMETPAIRMCIDTEHLFARGVNLWDAAVRKDFLAEYGSLISLVHLNCPDKEVTLGSFLDRHNTPFEDRKDLSHQGLIEDLSVFPMILERSSLAVQQKDNVYIRRVLGQPLEKQRA